MATLSALISESYADRAAGGASSCPRLQADAEALCSL
jgi:hypothetical protein